MSTMTLEQVRDSLLAVHERDRNGTAGDGYHAAWAKQLADAIDAHLRREVKVPDASISSERYAWLRNHYRFSNDSMQELWFDASINDSDDGNELDSSIDNAMLSAAPTYSGATDGQGGEGK